MAFFQNCFEEGSNLAILSKNYKIPDDNPYGDDLVDLIDRMLTVDDKERADMTEVIMCLSAMYANKNMPSRRKGKKHKDKVKSDQPGKYRTDGQGIHETISSHKKKPAEAKKLNPNSAAARRKAYRNTEQQLNTSSVPNSSSPTSLLKCVPDDTSHSHAIKIKRSSSSLTRGSGTKVESFDESFDVFSKGFGFGGQQQQIGLSSSSSFRSTDRLFPSSTDPFPGVDSKELETADHFKDDKPFEFGNFDLCLPSATSDNGIGQSVGNGNDDLFDSSNKSSFPAFNKNPPHPKNVWNCSEKSNMDAIEAGYGNGNFQEQFSTQNAFHSDIQSNNDGFEIRLSNFPTNDIDPIHSSSHDSSVIEEGRSQQRMKPVPSESIRTTEKHNEKSNFDEYFFSASVSKSTSSDR